MMKLADAVSELTVNGWAAQPRRRGRSPCRGRAILRAQAAVVECSLPRALPWGAADRLLEIAEHRKVQTRKETHQSTTGMFRMGIAVHRAQ